MAFTDFLDDGDGYVAPSATASEAGLDQTSVDPGWTVSTTSLPHDPDPWFTRLPDGLSRDIDPGFSAPWMNQPVRSGANGSTGDIEADPWGTDAWTSGDGLSENSPAPSLSQHLQAANTIAGLLQPAISDALNAPPGTLTRDGVIGRAADVLNGALDSGALSPDHFGDLAVGALDFLTALPEDERGIRGGLVQLQDLHGGAHAQLQALAARKPPADGDGSDALADAPGISTSDLALGGRPAAPPLDYNSKRCEAGGRLNLFHTGPGQSSWDKMPAGNTFSADNPYPGTFFVEGHGDPGKVLDDNYKKLNPDALSARILNDPRYRPGQPVTLGSCRTAGDYAQELANKLHVCVTAPVGYADYHGNGGSITSLDKTTSRATPWRIYCPIR
jgi:hypothetical protein